MYGQVSRIWNFWGIRFFNSLAAYPGVLQVPSSEEHKRGADSGNIVLMLISL